MPESKEEILIPGDVTDAGVWEKIADESVQTCVTSPPYWGLRDYGTNGQLGLEKTPEEYLEKMVQVFRYVRQKLRKDGTVWLNMGDSYAGGGKGNYGTGISTHGGTVAKHLSGSNFPVPEGLKPKDLCMMPARLAIALQADGWWLRSEIVWAKPNPMPESVTDRPTKSHEMIYLLTKSAKYYYDQEAVRVPHSRDWRNNGGSMYHPEQFPEGSAQRRGGKNPPQLNPSGANLKTVWDIPTRPYSGAHFATFPPEIPERCIKAGTKPGDIVLDPFAGSGTTLEVAKRMGRRYIGIELNEKYIKELIEPRLALIDPLFTEIEHG